MPQIVRETSHPLVNELVRVHDMLRRDLRTCRDLADVVRSGASPAHLRRAVDQLATRSLLFQLRARCLGFCQLVHAHHGGEDRTLFPVVRRGAPQLSAVLDRLESDHRVVSDLLDEIEVTALHLDDGTAPHDDTASRAARSHLADALGALSEHLLEHLDLEEQALAPVLQTWAHWPDEWADTGGKSAGASTTGRRTSS